MDIDVEISVSNLRAISIPTTAVGQPVLSGTGWLAGWSLIESTGAATATCQISSGGNVIGVIGLAAGASSNIFFGEKGIYCRGDITLTVTAGSVRGAVYATFLRPGSDYQS